LVTKLHLPDRKGALFSHREIRCGPQRETAPMGRACASKPAEIRIELGFVGAQDRKQHALEAARMVAPPLSRFQRNIET